MFFTHNTQYTLLFLIHVQVQCDLAITRFTCINVCSLNCLDLFLKYKISETCLVCVCVCFASFYYLVIHSILFHYIHAFIWIFFAPLIIFDHLYVSRVKLSSFLYPLSIMTRRGRNCGEYVVSFLRFYMSRGEIHALVRGSYVSSC